MPNAIRVVGIVVAVPLAIYTYERSKRSGAPATAVGGDAISAKEIAAFNAHRKAELAAQGKKSCGCVCV